MRNQPYRDADHRRRNGRRTDRDDGQSQEDRSAEGVVDAGHWIARHSAVENFHRGNQESGRYDRAGKEAGYSRAGQGRRLQATAIRQRDVAARAQASQSKRDRNDESDSGDDFPRAVLDGIVGILAKRVVSDDVDRVMRQCRRRRAGAQQKGTEHAETGTHAPQLCHHARRHLGRVNTYPPACCRDASKSNVRRISRRPF